MFLGTPRRWWIAAGLLFVAALILIGTDTGGTLGDVVGVLLLFASVGVFGMSPMRYGQGSRGPTTSPSQPAAGRSTGGDRTTGTATRDRGRRPLRRIAPSRVQPC